jgi:xanthine dehydrogenase accessory factor
MAADDPDLLERMAALRAEGRAFALATVVRTVAATSAKAGAKAIVTADGRLHGWIGGGCTEGAVKRAARQALEDGRSRLISVQPEAALETEGLVAGEAKGGVEFHRSTCPSGGTTDVFIEPLLPRPLLVVCGSSPVARAIADLGTRIGFALATAGLSPEDRAAFPAAETHVEGFDLPQQAAGERFIVVATQGRRDFPALEAALQTDAAFVAFVGSRRKIAALRERLIADGVEPARAAVVRSPAGLHIGAITPEEIALSVLAEIVEERRLGARASGSAEPPDGP